MIKRKIIFCIIYSYLILFTNNNNAQEILIYADDISFDSDENIVAKGNAKIFKNNQFILSDLIIYDKKNEKILLPSSFILKDEKNNYFQGTDGHFEKDLNYGSFNNVKIRFYVIIWYDKRFTVFKKKSMRLWIISITNVRNNNF